MVNYQRIALAVLSALALIPITVQAGAGGSPTAPSAGRSSDYCCAKWETGEVLRRDENGRNALNFVNGEGCQAIAPDDFSVNSCPGTVVKCRGEFFTPGASTASGPGKVERCLTP